MMIGIDQSVLDGFVRAWLRETLDMLEHNSAASYVHPLDKKTYKKDIKEVKRLLDYIGDDV
jgi:hypothetical protein